MKKLSVLLALCMIWAVGCDTEEKARNLMDSVVYMKDFRSNICFAAYRLDGGSIETSSLTYIPCIPAVEALIINKKPCEKQCSKNIPPLQPEQK